MLEIKTAESYITKNFQNLGSIESIKNLSTGPNSDSYYFQTKNGKYVLRYIHDHPSSSKIEQTCKILRYLKKNTMSVQDLINTDNDKFCDSKNFIYVTKFYEGILSKGTFAEIKDLAMNVALLHRFLYKTKIKFDFEHDIDPSFRILTLFDINRIRKIIVQRENKTGFDNKILNSLEFLKQIVSEQKKKQIKLRPYKFQLIHNDLAEKNIIFQRNRVKVILDFDGMKKGDILEDIAFTSLRFSTINNLKKSDVEKKIRHFVEHYLEFNDVDERKLSYLQNYSINDLLSKLSYILKKRYFYNNNMWIHDFDSLFKLLKCSSTIFWPK